MNWLEIKAEFEGTDITMKALAEKHNIKPSTLRSRKNREKWQRKEATQRNANVATKKVVETLQDNTELTEKQKLFCLYFSQFNNATKAYRKAYECDYESAMTNSSRLIRNDKIRAEIKQLKEARSNDWLISVDDIINEWIKMAFSDLGDYVEFKNYSVRLKSSNEVDGSIIQEITPGQWGTSIKLYDKQKALVELRKLIGTEDVHRLQLLETQVEKAKLELKEIKASIPGEDEQSDDGFLAAIDQSIESVWGDQDG